MKNSLQTVAIVIRCHGSIPIVQGSGLSLPEMVNLIPYETHNIKNMSVVNLADMGGVCYGEPDIDNFLKAVSITSKSRNLSTDDVITNIVNRTGYITESFSKVMGNSYYPKIVDLDSVILEKVYTKYNEKSKIAVLSCRDFNIELTTRLREKMANLTMRLLDGEPLTRSDILNELKEFNIHHLYLLDLTCNAFQATNDVPVREDTAVWLSSILNMQKLRGGRKTKNIPRNTRRKQNKTKKTKKQKNKKRMDLITK
jgi:hypothetical protein